MKVRTLVLATALLCAVQAHAGGDGMVSGDGSPSSIYNNSVSVPPDAKFGCAADEERVMRQDFSIGCARDVRPQQWR